MKLGNIILFVILGLIGYLFYSTQQAPPPAPVTQAVPAPAPVSAPLASAPVASAPAASAPLTPSPIPSWPVTPAPVASASPTPNGSWMYSVTSTPYDQIAGKKAHKH